MTMPTKAQTFRQQAIAAGIIADPRRETRTAAERGYDRQQRKARAAYMARHPLCEVCHVAPAVECDHRIPLASGGHARDQRNLRALCRRCHAECTLNYLQTGINEPIGAIPTLSDRGRTITLPDGQKPASVAATAKAGVFRGVGGVESC
jgi:hypothetical protein